MMPVERIQNFGAKLLYEIGSSEQSNSFCPDIYKKENCFKLKITNVVTINTYQYNINVVQFSFLRNDQNFLCINLLHGYSRRAYIPNLREAYDRGREKHEEVSECNAS